MIPIFEQGDGRGIGHNLRSFLDRFDDILDEHSKSGRAHALAFVLYDFKDREFKQILKDQGVFTQLDRLSGNDLSIFFLHTGSRKGVRAYNEHLLARVSLDQPAQTPCVIFCRFDGQSFYDVEVAELDSANLIHGLQELYSTIESYISCLEEPRRTSVSLRHLRSVAASISKETFRQGLRVAIEAALRGV